MNQINGFCVCESRFKRAGQYEISKSLIKKTLSHMVNNFPSACSSRNKTCRRFHFL